MTTEDKQILLQDLCARLPYGVKVTNGIYTITLKVRIDTAPATLAQFVNSDDLKYYLRPMESMTDEECNEYQELYDYEERSYNQGCDFYDEWKVEINDEERLFKITDWLNAHHFDYRGMIEKGLALEAPEGMYNIK